MKLEKAKEGFLAAKQDLSPRTLQQYTEALNILRRECGDRLPKKPDCIRRALNQAPTVWVKAAWWRTWGVFFNWCALEYGNPTPMLRVEKPKLPEVEMRALEPLELSRVLAAADNVQHKAILALALDSGIRASEFGRIRASHIGSDTIRIYGKGRKQLQVPLGVETRYLIESLMAEDSGRNPKSLVFHDEQGRPLSRFTIYRIVRQCMERANIEGPKLGPHALRHSLGKNFIAAGGDAFTLKRIMRHRNINTTLKYVNLAIGDVVKQHHEFSPLKDAIRGSQGILIEREVEEILEKS